jgi:phage recombination protein Bet
MTDIDLNGDALALLQRTICKPKERQATKDEVALFVGQCKRTGLDPFSKQIYAIFRKSQGEEVMTIQTAIDGFRLIAERSGTYAGKAATYWCGSDREWQEVWLEETHPLAAKVIVRKVVAGTIVEVAAVAHWDEYYDSYSPMWKERKAGGMPANQLAKCAESLALRQAFPNDLSGLYTTDEMAQADAKPLAVVEATAIEAPTDDRPLTAEERAEVVKAFEDAEVDIEMHLTAAGVDSTDDLTESGLALLNEKLAEYAAEKVPA